MNCLVTNRNEYFYIVNESIREIIRFEVRMSAYGESIFKQIFSIPFTIKDIFMNGRKAFADAQWQRGDKISAHFNSDFYLNYYLDKGYTLKEQVMTSEAPTAGADSIGARK